MISTIALSNPGWMNVNRATTDAHGAIWAADHRLWRCDLRTGRVTRLIPASPDLTFEALKVVYRHCSGVLWNSERMVSVCCCMTHAGSPSIRNACTACG